MSNQVVFSGKQWKNGLNFQIQIEGEMKLLDNYKVQLTEDIICTMIEMMLVERGMNKVQTINSREIASATVLWIPFI